METDAPTFLDQVEAYLKQRALLYGENVIYADIPDETPAVVTEDPVSLQETEQIDSPVLSGSAAEQLREYCLRICDCQKCPLGRTRTKFVFGTGNADADLMLVGEAPGRDEDLRGEPFVGAAGKLLNQILAAVKFSREEVYIANILKCRPPNNRDPLPPEVEQCEPYLLRQIEIVKPRLILALGRQAAQNLLKTTESLSALRGRVHDYHGAKLMVTYHPAALLRNTQWKRPTWEDVQKARALHDDLTGAA